MGETDQARRAHELANLAAFQPGDIIRTAVTGDNGQTIDVRKYYVTLLGGLVELGSERES